MELSSAKNEPAQNESGSVHDLRTRVDGKERFRRAWLGYQRRQVDNYLREQSIALTRERQAHAEQLAGLRQELGRLQASLVRQEEQQAAEERHQSQLDSLNTRLDEAREQLRKSEVRLAAALDNGSEAQQLSDQLRELAAENLRLSNEAQQFNCQLAAKEQLADQLRQKNRELEAAAEQSHQKLLSARLIHSRGLDGMRAVQNDCIATLSSQLQCCQELLQGYRQGMEEQIKLIQAAD